MPIDKKFPTKKNHALQPTNIECIVSQEHQND